MSDNPRVRDIMSSPVKTIPRTASVSEAAAKMRTEEIRALLVTTSPPSIITSADILEAVAENRDTTELGVTELMTDSVETVPPTLHAGEAAAMMTTFGVGHLPVLDGGDYVGIISSTDIAEQFS
jgi:Predicted signal-transduction protein containing cAMP-binding and CBS domains